MAALATKIIAGYRVHIWRTCFRVEGDAGVTRIGRHMTEDDIEQYILQNYPPRNQEKKTMSMNLNTLAFLVRDDVTTCSIVFATGSQKEYVFKITQKLADKCTVGDQVVVDTCNGLRVGELSGVHDEPQIDPEDDVEYRWAFQRVNLDLLEELTEQERTIEDRLKARRKLSHRQQALAALGISNPEEFMRELTGPKE